MLLRIIISRIHIKPGTGTQGQSVGEFLTILNFCLKLTLCLIWQNFVSSLLMGKFWTCFSCSDLFLFLSSTSFSPLSGLLLILYSSSCPYVYFSGSYIEDLAFWFDIHPITLQLPLCLVIPEKEQEAALRKVCRQENVIKLKVWQGSKWGEMM